MLVQVYTTSEKISIISLQNLGDLDFKQQYSLNNDLAHLI